MNHSEQFNEVAAALAKAQGQMEFAEKSGLNPHFKSKYATLAAVVDACKAALSSNEIAVVQYGQDCDNGVTLETVFYHSSGQYISAGTTHVPAQKYDAHGYGSALTYARRYALATACGVPQEDDDCNAAKANPPVRKPQSVSKTALEGIEVDWVQAGEYASGISAAIHNEDEAGIRELMEELSEDADMKIAVWTKLDSKQRSHIKKLTAAA